MAKHKAFISRWVCESVEVEVEAESQQDALAKAAKLYHAGDTDDLDWNQDASEGCRDATISVGNEFMDLDDEDDDDEDLEDWEGGMDEDEDEDEEDDDDEDDED